VRATRAVRRVLRVRREVGLPHRLGEAGEDGVLVRRDQHHAIRGPVDVRRRDVRQDRAGALADVARLVVLGHERLHHVEHRLVDRRVDHLAAAGLVAVVQGGEGADAGERGCQRVTDRDAHPRRRRRGVAHDVAQATHRLADRAEAGLPRIRARLPETGHTDHDQAGVDRRQFGPPESPFFHRARPEILEQEVRLLDEVLEQRLAVGLAQVERDRFLVAGDDRPPEGLAVRLLASPDAHRVALARRLDLDDLRAEVPEQLAAERTGQQGAEFDHAQARERARFEAGWAGHAKCPVIGN